MTPHYKSYLCIFGLGLIYILFPTQNSWIDAYNYAYAVKYKVDLFHPHHLLYNIAGLGFFNLIHFSSIEVLPAMKLMNALMGIATLIIFYHCLKTRLTNEASEIWKILLFCGSCFGFMRFNTENETYILPLFFSLLGSLYYLKYQKEKKDHLILLCSLYAVIACLFHQIHFFWWLGLGVGLLYNQGIKRTLLFIIPAFIVPLAYLLVIKLHLNQSLNVYNIQHFVFHEFYGNAVQSNVDIKNFIFTPINFIRTFLQVHGNILLFIQKNSTTYFIIGLVLLFFLYVTLRTLWNYRFEIRLKEIEFTHAFIFILQLIFAFYSVGNAEFMVMLPFLIFLSIYPHRVFLKPIFPLACFLFIWNMSFAIYPNHSLNYFKHEKVVEYIRNNPEYDYMLKDKNVIQSMYVYLHNYPTPPIYRLLDREKLQVKLSKNTIITDILDKPVFTSRKSIILSNNEFMNKIKTSPVLKIDAASGTYHLQKLCLK